MYWYLFFLFFLFMVCLCHLLWMFTSMHCTWQFEKRKENIERERFIFFISCNNNPHQLQGIQAKAKVPSTLLSMRFKVTIWADSFTLLFFSFLNVYNRTQFLFSNVQPKFGCQFSSSEWATEITEFVMKTEIICKQNTPWELFEIRQELRALCLRVDEHLTTENFGWLLDKPYWTIKKKENLKKIINLFCTNFNYDPLKGQTRFKRKKQLSSTTSF